MSDFEWMVRSVQRAVLWAQPDGGQGRARRNAWSAMVQDNRRRAERLAAHRSIRAATATPTPVEKPRPQVAAVSG
jgi:hypothetical protein